MVGYYFSTDPVYVIFCKVYGIFSEVCYFYYIFEDYFDNFFVAAEVFYFFYSSVLAGMVEDLDYFEVLFGTEEMNVYFGYK